MFNVKNVVKRAVMIMLFLGALFTTVETISGLDVRTMAAWKGSEAQLSHYIPRLSEEREKQSEVMWASITNVVKSYVIRAEETAADSVSTLEEKEDWTKYPSVEVEATGYTAGVESTGKKPGHPTYGITYSGIKVKRDLYSTIAADPDVFPIGTILFIPDYGYGVVADTGSKIKGNKIDLYYETVDEVYEEWGKKTVEVYIVQEGNGKITEEELEALNEDETMQVFRQQYLRKSEE